MNKLITTILGGHPLALDDLRFQNEAFREALKSLATLGKTTNYIISGCELIDAGSDWELTDGVCCIDGEIRNVRGGTLPKDINVKFVIAPVDAPSSSSDALRLFQSGITHNVWEVRDAEFTTSTAPTFDGVVPLVFDNTSSLGGQPIAKHDFVFALRRAVVSDWKDLTNIGTFPSARYAPGFPTPRANMTPSGIQLWGRIDYTDIGQETSISDTIFEFNEDEVFNTNPKTTFETSQYIAPSISDTPLPYDTVLLEVNRETIKLRGDIKGVPTATSGTFHYFSLDGIFIPFQNL